MQNEKKLLHLNIKKIRERIKTVLLPLILEANNKKIGLCPLNISQCRKMIMRPCRTKKILLKHAELLKSISS